MEDNNKEHGKKFNLEIKNLVILLASGAFAKLHRKFLAPHAEEFQGDHWLNLSHHFLHSIIGLAIQIVLLLWIVKFIIAAGKAAFGEIKSRGAQDGN